MDPKNHLGIYLLLISLVGLFACTSADDHLPTTSHFLDGVNPRDQEYPGGRSAGSMIVYTPAFGDSTGTNQWGTEAVVQQGIVLRVGGNNSAIPEDGWVLSGHGEAANWIAREVHPGMAIRYDQDSVYGETGPASRERYVHFLLDHPYGQPDDVKRDESNRLLRQYQTTRDVILLDSSLHLALDYQYSGALPYFGIHGVWWDIRDLDSASMRQSVINMVGLGIQVVFPQVIFNGYAIYPDADPDLPQDPRFTGWDPLGYLMELTKEYPISVVPWVWVYYVGKNISPLAQNKPDWLATSRTGHHYSDMEPGYHFFCPSEQAVDDFWIEVYRHMFEKYGIDAIQLDYIRYPVSIPWEQDFCYCDRCTGLFKKEFGVDPSLVTPSDSTMWANWNNYRIQQINRMVRHLHEAFPQIRIGVDVFPDRESSLVSKKQDWPYWNESGWVQALFPMSYTSDTATVRTDARYLKSQAQPGTLTLLGLGPYLQYDALTLLQQIDIISAERLDGFVLFEWNSLTPEMKRALKIGPFRYY